MLTFDLPLNDRLNQHGLLTDQVTRQSTITAVENVIYGDSINIMNLAWIAVELTIARSCPFVPIRNWEFDEDPE